MAPDKGDLRKIIEKLDHELSEVRKRSLKNILSKLSCSIIQEEDLIHHNNLFHFLLEFLNRKEEVKKVLELLLNLSGHPAGSQTLISLGAVDFLTSFRQDIGDESGILQLVDFLIDKLFYVHTDDETTRPNPTYITKAATCQDDPSHYQDAISQQIQEISSRYEMEKQYSQHESSDEITFHFEKQNIVPNSTTNHTFGVHESRSHELSNNETEAKLSSATFRWVSLTSGDRHILAVTENRIKNASPMFISQSCQFFRNVLLHDFPAEVFIQRPSIIQSMLVSLLTYHSKRTDISEEILTCLLTYTESLYERILRNESVELWSSKFDSTAIHASSVSTNVTESSSLSNMTSQNINRGEDVHVRGNREERQVEKDNDFESSVITEALIQGQMHHREYSNNVLSSITNLLMVYMNENHLFSLVTEVFIAVLKLMKISDFHRAWQNSTKHNNKLVWFNVL